MAYLELIRTPDDVKKLNNEELLKLSAEIREFLVKNITKTGGHLASNLGIVELTLAIMKQTDLPKDKVIFDVGHQCYVYKMLTGRLDRFDTLRKLGGISGFPKTDESIYDSFDVGHASTSISAAVGMARARDLNGTDENIIAVVGDGALTGGMCFEALNDVGSRKTKLIVILNDNQMSIQKNIGGLSRHLTNLRLAPKYKHTKNNIHGLLGKAGKFGKKVDCLLKKAKNRFKYATIAAPLFENLGLTYMGIIDGNNISEVAKAIELAKNVDGPVLIHVCTKKGLGYKAAEENPSKFHGISSITSKLNRSAITYTNAFGKILNDIATSNSKVVAITAAMSSGCGLDEFAKTYPDRFFDVGIAEEHAVTMAAGFAQSGFAPIFAVYSTFLQRAYDQIVHDVCLQNLHVVFAIDRAGLTGEDGETHQGLLDFTFLSHIPNMTVLAPTCYDELKQMMAYAVNECKGPVAIRYPKSQISFRKCSCDFEVGKSETVKAGNDVLIVAFGRMLDCALETANMLENDGIYAQVVNARCVKPMDIQSIQNASNEKKLIVTLEDNVIDGGAGQRLLANCEFLQFKTLCLGFETCYISHGKQQELFEINHLDAKSVYDRIKREINENDR